MHVHVHVLLHVHVLHADTKGYREISLVCFLRFVLCTQNIRGNQLVIFPGIALYYIIYIYIIIIMIITIPYYRWFSITVFALIRAPLKIIIPLEGA